MYVPNPKKYRQMKSKQILPLAFLQYQFLGFVNFESLVKGAGITPRSDYVNEPWNIYI